MILSRSFLLLTPIIIFLHHQQTHTKWLPFIKSKATQQDKAGSKKLIKEQTWDELVANLLKITDNETQIRYREAMALIAPNQDAAAANSYALAECYAQAKMFTKAKQEFAKFIQLAPESPDVDKAFYRQIQCCAELRLIPDRDQTETIATLELTDLFLKQYEQSNYTAAVQAIQKECKTLLALKEQHIIEDQIHRKDYLSALGRINNMRDKFLTDFPNLTEQLASYEQKIPELFVQAYAERQKNKQQSKKETALT